MKAYELFIAWRYMMANLKQSLIIMFAVGMGVAVIVWVPSINLSFFNDLIDRSVSSAPHISITKELKTFQRDVRVLKREYKDAFLLTDQTITRRRNIRSYKEVVNQIKNLNEVVATAPFASGQAFVIRGAEERGVSIKGIVPDDELKVVDIQKDIIKGRIKNLAINEIVIGSQLAEKVNVGLGDRVTVVGPRGSSKTLKIAGIFATGLRAKDESQIYVSLKSGQQILSIGTDVSGVGVKVKDIYKAEEIAREMEKITGLYVTSWMEDNQQILDQINRFRLIILFINFLIIFSAASSITSVFILLISSKAKEIGILKSMGAKNLSVMVIFVIQAVILSLFGYLIGLVGAKLLIMWYASILSTSQGTLFSTSIPKFNIDVNYALVALMYSVLTSMLASILPAYQAAKLNPVEAING